MSEFTVGPPMYLQPDGSWSDVPLPSKGPQAIGTITEVRPDTGEITVIWTKSQKFLPRGATYGRAVHRARRKAGLPTTRAPNRRKRRWTITYGPPIVMWSAGIQKDLEAHFLLDRCDPEQPAIEIGGVAVVRPPV